MLLYRPALILTDVYFCVCSAQDAGGGVRDAVDSVAGVVQKHTGTTAGAGH